MCDNIRIITVQRLNVELGNICFTLHFYAQETQQNVSFKSRRRYSPPQHVNKNRKQPLEVAFSLFNTMSEYMYHIYFVITKEQTET